jgi:hypothetical protein
LPSRKRFRFECKSLENRLKKWIRFDAKNFAAFHSLACGVRVLAGICANIDEPVAIGDQGSEQIQLFLLPLIPIAMLD